MVCASFLIMAEMVGATLLPETLTSSDSGKCFRTQVEKCVKVRLAENPSTGYRWSWVGKSEVIVLRAYKYRPRCIRPGAGGEACFCFQAVQPGRGKILLEYSRPWENQPVATFSCDVEVAPKG